MRQHEFPPGRGETTMMQSIDPEKECLVDLTDGRIIKGAEAADFETGEVAVREITYSGEVRRTVQYLNGIRLVRRR